MKQAEIVPIAVTIPSKKYGCDGARYYSAEIEGLTDFYVSSHTLTWDVKDFCGIPQMDAYYDTNAGIFNLFRAGGDGTVIGSCYPQSPQGSLRCEAAFDEVVCSDAWVCYSELCK